MDLNHDVGSIDSVLILDTTEAPPSGGNTNSLQILGTGALYLPHGNTAARPANSVSMIRYNTDLNVLEFNTGVMWSVVNVDGINIVTYTAGAALGGHRMVVLDTSSHAIYADGATLTHANKVVGMTTGAAIMGDPVRIQTNGPLIEPSWTWTLDVPVWLGLNGLLTQTPPTTIFSLIIGFPVTSTQLFINIKDPIFLT